MADFELCKDLVDELAMAHRYLLQELNDLLGERVQEWAADIRRYEVHKATIVRDWFTAESCISPYPWPLRSRITSWFRMRHGEWMPTDFVVDAAHLLCPAGHPVRLSFIVSWPRELDRWKFWRDPSASCCSQIKGLEDVSLAP